MQKSSLHQQLQHFWDILEYKLKSLSVILTGLCVKLFLTKVINFHKCAIKSHSYIELYFNEHTFTAFYINLKEPIITYILHRLLSHSVLIISLNNTQLSSKRQPQLFEIPKSILYGFFSFPFFHQIHKSIYPSHSFLHNQKKGAKVLVFYIIKMIKYTGTPFYLCKEKSNYLSIYSVSIKKQCTNFPNIT